MTYRVLLATDGSDSARRAARTAADFARSFNGEVLVIYVVPPVPALIKAAVQAGNQSLNGSLAALQAEMLNGQRALKHAADTLIQAGAPYTARLDQGDPVERICEIARAEDCDVIVVGQHRLEHPMSRTLGEISLRISICAPCTVVVVA